MDISAIINELGEERSQYYNAIAPPVFQASNFAFDKVDDLRAAFADEMSTYIYSKGLNPTINILRKKMAALDGAEDCLIFNNGSAAIFSGILSCVKAGDHIVSVKNPYSWAGKTMDVFLPRFGVTTTYIEGADIVQWENAIRPNTRLLYMESPNSWNFSLQPIKEITTLAKARGIYTMIDNTHCTPLYQPVIEMGVDLAMQTATKYIGGHSDVLGGILSGSKELIKKIFELELMNAGNGISPYNAWLLIRGLRTLPIRLERIQASTEKVLPFLKQHSKIEKIIFPFDPDFPQYELAKSQMKAVFGLVTLQLKARSRGDIVRFCEALNHILLAVSWGGHESLIIPKCAGLQEDEFDVGNPEHRWVRLYIGLEDPEYIIKDLQQALEKL